MVQDQLVEYISSQLKLGISRDAVKAALASAGWTATDVEDTLKKVEGASKPAAPAASSTQSAPAVSSKPAYSPMGASSFTAQKSFPGASAGGAAKAADQPSIKVSDLISTSGSAMSFSGNSAAGQQNKGVKNGQPVMSPVKMKMEKGGLIVKIVGFAVILGLGGFAGYLYFQNNDLAAKVAALGGASADVTSRVSALTGQVQALNASNTALAAEVDSMTAENALLRANLSFAAIPPAPSGASTSPETLSISGKLTAGRSSYILTTLYGVLVFVQNTKDAKVDAALKPLLMSTSSVMLTGTHVPGSQYITVTAVNGSPL